MKKILSFVLCMLLFLFALPLVTVTRSAAGQVAPQSAPAVEASVEPATAYSKTEWDVKQKVSVCIDGVSRDLDMRSYLIGVMAAEMPASFPEEALRAQAVAARTYTLYKQRLYTANGIPECHHGAELCDDPGHCKAWCDVAVQASSLWGDSTELYLEKLTAAVDSTDGMILVYDGEPIAAVFHSASVGRTENAEDVWGSAVPYLVSVESPGGEDSPKNQSETRISQESFRSQIALLAPDADLSGDAHWWFRDSNRSEAGGVLNVMLGGVRVRGTLVRQAASLCSMNFRVRVDGDDLVFTTTGSGHGVGLSQYGARALAQDGADYTDILLHYYTGVQLLKKSQ